MWNPNFKLFFKINIYMYFFVSFCGRGGNLNEISDFRGLSFEYFLFFEAISQF